MTTYYLRYWILKRKAGGNKPLLIAREDEVKTGSARGSGEDTEKDKKMLVNIRQVKFITFSKLI